MSPPIQHHPSPSSAASTASTARGFVIVTVLGIFAILGILIAYNSGATAEEAENDLINRRIGSIAKRLFACEHEVATVSGGAEVKFGNRKSGLDLSLDSLQKENELYNEQAKNVASRLGDCQEDLANERKKKTGAPEDNVTDAILRLRYNLKTVEGAIEIANETRMHERQRILRVVEAYAKENDELMTKVQQEEDKRAKGVEDV